MRAFFMVAVVIITATELLPTATGLQEIGGVVIAIFLTELLFGFESKRVIPIIGIAVLPCGHICKRSTEILCKLLPELLRVFGIAVIVFPALLPA